MLETWFATPLFLYALTAVPVALALFLFSFVRRKQLATRLSAPLLLRKSVLVRSRWRRFKATCILFALGLTALASAGPQWGLDRDAQFRKGRDVIVVLDLSRSMFAEQPSRRDRAVKALRHLADAFENHGGNRVALVGFATKARLFFPFTQDCQHLRHTLDQIETDDYAKLTEANADSGTRLGVALKLAVDSCDLTHSQRPVIDVLSDGDDPADDDEWREGVAAASESKVRVHVVGVGNPDKAETIPVGNELLQFDGAIVRTRLNEERLRDIAQRTGGEYLPAHRADISLGTYVLHWLDSEELRTEPTAATLPVYQLRYAWFLLPAVVLFMLTMLISDGSRPAVRAAAASATPKSKAATIALMLAAVFCISASDPPTIETLLRQGDDAFARQKFDEALGHYERAESMTQDPGRLSFNKAASLYRLDRYKEAIECYRRCLEDDTAPAERRARACFDLGNSLVKHADGDAREFGEAVAAYRAALHLADAAAPWRNSALHNLELAQLLLLKARKNQPEKNDVAKNKEKPKTTPEDKDGKKKDSAWAPVDPTKGFKVDDAKDGPKGSKSKSLFAGPIDLLPDKGIVTPLSPEATLATLEQEARRIAAARRQQYNPPGPAQLSTKEW